MTPVPLPRSSRPSSPANSCGAAILTTRTSARPRRGPRWTGQSVPLARYLRSRGCSRSVQVPGEPLPPRRVAACVCVCVRGAPHELIGTPSLPHHSRLLHRVWHHLIAHLAGSLPPILQMRRVRPRQAKEGMKGRLQVSCPPPSPAHHAGSPTCVLPPLPQTCPFTYHPACVCPLEQVWVPGHHLYGGPHGRV